MSIFGLPNQDVTWAEFGKLTKNSKFRDSWIDAITSVVTSSLQGQLDVDNSQVIVSNDERHAFRVILTTGTRYFNGIREFSLYFVEYLAAQGRFHDSGAKRAGIELPFQVSVSRKKQRVLPHEYPDSGAQLAARAWPKH
jgi:hypothetical protein